MRQAFTAILFVVVVVSEALVSADELARWEVPGLTRSALGVTRAGTAMRCWVPHEVATDERLHVLFVGGLASEPASVAAVQRLVTWLRSGQEPEAEKARGRFLVSAVPCGNPDGLAKGLGLENGAGGRPSRGYPPAGPAYHSPTDPEAAYLWRWIGMHAPDLVVVVRVDDRQPGWFVPESLPRLRAAWKAESVPAEPEDGLVPALTRVAPCETGTIPAVALRVATKFDDALPRRIFADLDAAESLGPSPARHELERRRARTPREVAGQLSRKYGHELGQVAYIPALPLISRLRLGALTNDPEHRRDVERIVGPYVRGEKKLAPKSGSELAGHLVFAELADRELADRSTGAERERYLALARLAADLAFDKDGAPLPSMPFHDQMSDALFMGGPILARVGRLTGEARYLDACVRHLRFMRGLVARKDGLYRHSPLDESAWGRGNGFPALGLALVLDDFPANHPARGELLGWFREHLTALVPHQDQSGAWHQVIDREESYRELTCTCMIGYAMSRGLRAGWLDESTFRPCIDRAWQAVKSRVTPDGRLVDVCTGTGKQRSLRDYYDRQALLGPDARGGAMAFLFAMELAE